jgi:hypothetical protein
MAHFGHFFLKRQGLNDTGTSTCIRGIHLIAAKGSSRKPISQKLGPYAPQRPKHPNYRLIGIGRFHKMWGCWIDMQIVAAIAPVL